MSYTFDGIEFEVFSLSPQSDIQELLEFHTDILTPKNGMVSEQRISVRNVPRQHFSFPVILTEVLDRSRIEATVFGWMKTFWGLPVWSEKVIHTDDIDVDDMTIDVDTTNADFRDDSLAIIWQAPDQYEVVQIDTVSETSLSLLEAVQNNFTGKKLIMPCRISQISNAVKRQVHSTEVSEWNFSFSVKDNILLKGYTPSVTYKGYPVLKEATWIDPTQELSIDSDSFEVDYNLGDFRIYSDSLFNLNTQSYLCHHESKAACWEFREFLHSRFGMQGVVYVPSHKNDMTLAQTIGSAETSFNIVHIGLTDNVGVNELLKDVAFIFPDGTQLYREITDITESGDEEIVTIDSALGVEVDPGDCVISFMNCCRLASDAVKISWSMAHQNYSKLMLMSVTEPLPMEGNYPTLQITDGEFQFRDDLSLTHTIAISNVTELQNMNNDLYANYYLTQNIDASETSAWNDCAGFLPIGSVDPFAGSLDGCGYSIYNLYINRPTTSKIGLFATVYNITNIANVFLRNAVINGDDNVGSLVGEVIGLPA